MSSCHYRVVSSFHEGAGGPAAREVARRAVDGESGAALEAQGEALYLDREYAAAAGWHWAFAVLAVGPLAGIVAMRRLLAARHLRTMAKLRYW